MFDQGGEVRKEIVTLQQQLGERGLTICRLKLENEKLTKNSDAMINMQKEEIQRLKNQLLLSQDIKGKSAMTTQDIPVSFQPIEQGT